MVKASKFFFFYYIIASENGREEEEKREIYAYTPTLDPPAGEHYYEARKGSFRSHALLCNAPLILLSLTANDKNEPPSFRILAVVSSRRHQFANSLDHFGRDREVASHKSIRIA